jgi:hypothetical protein
MRAIVLITTVALGVMMSAFVPAGYTTAKAKAATPSAMMSDLKCDFWVEDDGLAVGTTKIVRKKLEGGLWRYDFYWSVSLRCTPPWNSYNEGCTLYLKSVLYKDVNSGYRTDGQYQLYDSYSVIDTQPFTQVTGWSNSCNSVGKRNFKTSVTIQEDNWYRCKVWIGSGRGIVDGYGRWTEDGNYVFSEWLFQPLNEECPCPCQ